MLAHTKRQVYKLKFLQQALCRYVYNRSLFDISTEVGIFLELDTLDSCPVHFGIIESLVTSLCQASKLVYSSWICIIGTCS